MVINLKFFGDIPLKKGYIFKKYVNDLYNLILTTPLSLQKCKRRVRTPLAKLPFF
jgi:hypothetical protein